MYFEDFTHHSHKFLIDFFHQSKTTENRAIIDEFVNYIRTYGSVSINLSMEQLVEVLSTKEYKNIFQFGFQDDQISNHYTNYHPQLVEFVKRFNFVKNAKYGALNTGNFGVPFYGNNECCLHLKKRFVEDLEIEKSIYFLKYFSLNYFHEKTHDFNEKRFLEEIANNENVPYLAHNKYFRKYINLPTSEWNELICNAVSYIEAMIFEPITISEFAGVYINGELFDGIIELKKVTEVDLSDKLRILQLNEIQKICKKEQISFIVQR